MAVEIRHIRGMCRGVEQDTTIDGVYVVDALNPKGNLVGIVGREPGAPVQLIEMVSASVVKEIAAAVDARDFDELPEEKQQMAKGRRAVARPVAIEKDEEAEENEDAEG